MHHPENGGTSRRNIWGFASHPTTYAGSMPTRVPKVLPENHDPGTTKLTSESCGSDDYQHLTARCIISNMPKHLENNLGRPPPVRADYHKPASISFVADSLPPAGMCYMLAPINTPGPSSMHEHTEKNVKLY